MIARTCSGSKRGSLAMAGQVAAAHSPSRSSPGVDVDDDVDFVIIKNQPETENLVGETIDSREQGLATPDFTPC